MTPDADAKKMRKQRDLIATLRMGGLVQLAAVLLSGLILAAGLDSIVACLSAGYWAGVILILAIRRQCLTRGDHYFIRYGLILILGVPTAIFLWRTRAVL